MDQASTRQMTPDAEAFVRRLDGERSSVDYLRPGAAVQALRGLSLGCAPRCMPQDTCAMRRRPVVRVAVICWLALTVAACATPSPVPTELGHIRGTFVFRGGPYPGVTEPERDATIAIVRLDGTVVARSTTNANGLFAVDVPVGTYTVGPLAQLGPVTQSVTVTVDDGKTVDVSLAVDVP